MSLHRDTRKEEVRIAPVVLPTPAQWRAAALKQAEDILRDACFTIPRGGISYEMSTRPNQGATPG